MSDENAFREWAILELFGHQRMGGYVTPASWPEGFIRIDIPGESGDFTDTHLFNPKATYGIRPTTQEVATAFARHNRPQPVHPWELPPARPVVAEDPDDQGDDDGAEIAETDPWG
jgi:hypothetical protein